VFSLSSALCCPVTLAVALIPDVVPFVFILQLRGNQGLFDLEVWIDGCEVSGYGRLVSTIFMVPVKNFNSLGHGCIPFLYKNWSFFYWS